MAKKPVAKSKPKRTFTDAERKKILREVDKNGAAATAKKYKLSSGSIYQWRARFKVGNGKPKARKPTRSAKTKQTRRSKAPKLDKGTPEHTLCLSLQSAREAFEASTAAAFAKYAKSTTAAFTNGTDN